MAGASSKRALVICTVPRLVGLRLHTLAVMAGKLCSGSPNASRLSGCTWYSRLGHSKSGEERVKAPSWLGAMLMGPVRRNRYSSPMPALPQGVLANWLSVRAPRTL
jgi:hypothetical protein